MGKRWLDPTEWASACFMNSSMRGQGLTLLSRDAGSDAGLFRPSKRGPDWSTSRGDHLGVATAIGASKNYCRLTLTLLIVFPVALDFTLIGVTQTGPGFA